MTEPGVVRQVDLKSYIPLYRYANINVVCEVCRNAPRTRIYSWRTADWLRGSWRSPIWRFPHAHQAVWDFQGDGHLRKWAILSPAYDSGRVISTWWGQNSFPSLCSLLLDHIVICLANTTSIIHRMVKRISGTREKKWTLYGYYQRTGPFS
jgi:hypothetical protein